MHIVVGDMRFMKTTRCTIAVNLDINSTCQKIDCIHRMLRPNTKQNYDCDYCNTYFRASFFEHFSFTFHI